MELVARRHIRFGSRSSTPSRTQPRYLGQVELGPNDVTAVKLFATNRNGAEAVNVLMRDLTIRADRINGLGTVGPHRLRRGGVRRPDVDRKRRADRRRSAQAAGPAARSPGTFPPTSSRPWTGLRPRRLPPAGAPRAGRRGAAPAVPSPRRPRLWLAMVVGRSGPAVARHGQSRPGRAGACESAVASDAVPTAMAVPPAAPRPAQPAAATKPKAKIPLDEVDSIRFERTPALAARFMGQPNLDFTMPGLSCKKEEPAPEAGKTKAGARPRSAEPKKDETKKADAARQGGSQKKDAATARSRGKERRKPRRSRGEESKEARQQAKDRRSRRRRTRCAKAEEKKTDGSDDVLAPPPGHDDHQDFPRSSPRKTGFATCALALFGLRDGEDQASHRQLPDRQGARPSWRLDTTDSQDWPLVIRRPGNDISADLFLEPPPGDCHQKNFTITVMYEDGQAGNATARPRSTPIPSWPSIPRRRRFRCSTPGST